MGLWPIFYSVMKIFETHTHLLDSSFDEDRETTIEKIKEAGVLHAIEACCKLQDIDPILALCKAYPMLLPTAGIHPEEIIPGHSIELNTLEKTVSEHRFYAIGEIGLDYHYEDMCPKEIQLQYFDAQLAIAAKNALPVIIHDRDAHGDCLDILKGYKGKLKGVMHCFSGSRETAKECLDLGLHLGFGGVITFKNAKKSRAVLESMPIDRILFETDSPYMAPEPFRGTRNDSSLLPYIIKAAAAVRGEEPEMLAENVYQNSVDLFGVN